MPKPFSWYLMKLDRVAAWTLLATMFLYFVSGYGMTKGIISSRLAVNIHDNWLPLVLISAFSIHTCYAISLAFKRWRIWNIFTNIALVGVYLTFFAFFVFINSFYTKPVSKVINTQTTNITQGTTQSPTTTPTPSPNPTPSPSTGSSTPSGITMAQVATHNSWNSSCWIVISGVVYDITSYQHSGPQSHIYCGQDNTAALSSAHGTQYASYFSQSKVGNLVQ